MREMERVKDGLKKLRRMIHEGQRDPALAEVALLEEASLRAKLLVPVRAQDVPEAERAAFVRDYRKGMVELVAAELALETALLEDDFEAARAALEALSELEDPAHGRFTREDD
jgi:hypothetical protein